MSTVTVLAVVLIGLAALLGNIGVVGLTRANRDLRARVDVLERATGGHPVDRARLTGADPIPLNPYSPEAIALREGRR